MPELPDVETIRRRVEERALHRTVETVGVPSDRLLEGTSGSTLRDALRGHRLQETLRHGKHLFLRSGEDRRRWLRLHFGMTGSLVIRGPGEPPAEPDHVYLRLELEGGTTLSYRCPRTFGEIGLVEDPEVFVEEEGLGPDAWGGGVTDALPPGAFADAVEGRTGMLESTLMNQEVVAGLGNVYVDEILFQAGLHPETPVDALERDALLRLADTIREVLDGAVAAGADPESLPDDWLLPCREERDCPRCPGRVIETTVAGRTTWLCDTHQEGP
jgi:formamidopyrimidine-DNA glycosylase